MTTIALDANGLIAYDSREVAGNTIADDDSDKRRNINGVHYFFAGRSADEDMLIDAVENGGQPDYSDSVNVCAIVVKGGEVFTAGITSTEGFYLQKERKGNPVARGSGGDHALTAMDLGCTAKEAVKYAMKRDNNTGGKIRTFQV